MKKLIIIALICVLVVVIGLLLKSADSLDIIRATDLEGNSHSFVFIFLNQDAARYIRLGSPDILSVNIRNLKIIFIVPGPIMDSMFIA